MRHFFSCWLILSMLMLRPGIGAEPIYLGLLERPSSMRRLAPKPEIFGEWKLESATPDGMVIVQMTVTEGPDNLVIASIRTQGDSDKSSPFEFDVSLSFYQTNETIFSIVRRNETASDTPLIGTFVLPVNQLVFVDADLSDLKICLPNTNALRLLIGTQMHLYQVTGSSYLLVDKSSEIEKALVESMSPKWFGEPNVVFSRVKDAINVGRKR